MTDILVTSPYQPFTLPTQFKAVFNGYIYCGTVDAVDPSVSQVQVYLANEDGSRTPVAQPLRTNAGGFLVYNGQPAKFVTSSNHSLLVRDSLGSQLWYAPDASIVDPESAYQTIGAQAFEALRRSYAEAGYNVVGTFQAGFTLVNANDVGIDLATGKGYTGPAGAVAAGTDPASGGFVDRSLEIFAKLTTTDSLSSGRYGVGSLVSVADRSLGMFIVKSGGTANGTSVVDAGNGNTAELIVTGEVKVEWLGNSDPDYSVITQNAVDFISAKKGGSVTTPAGVHPCTTTVEVKEGVKLWSNSICLTFSNAKGSVFEFNPSSANVPAIRLGDTSSSEMNRGMKIENIKVQGTGRQGTGISTINKVTHPTANNSLNFKIDKVVAQNLLIGFDIRDSWNYLMSQTTAIDCDVGHRISGTGVGAGTSSTWNACLSYNCRIGFDIEANGLAYSNLFSCGADGATIGLRIKGASSRGSKIQAFGIENIQPNGYGVLVDYTDSGYYDIDGLHFAIHNDPSVSFIRITNNRRIFFRGLDVPSSILGASKLYSQINPTSAGEVYFRDSSFYGNDLGDIFAENVRLQNTIVNGRLYVSAKGGIDFHPQKVTYTSAMAGASNNSIYSVNMEAVTDSAIDRVFTGTPIFDASKLSDYRRFTISKGNSTNRLIFRTETNLSGSGIVKNATLNPANDIILVNAGDSVTLEKRPDGKLYQVALTLTPTA